MSEEPSADAPVEWKRQFGGIDPGLTGAIALLRGEQAFTFDAPTVRKKVSGRTRLVLDIPRMVKLLRQLNDEGRALDYKTTFGIEWSQPMPKQGVVSVFSYGTGYGIWLGILATLGIAYMQIRPVAWKRVMLSGHGKGSKEIDRMVAQQLWPEIDLGQRHDQGRADALLIAAFTRKFFEANEGGASR